MLINTLKVLSAYGQFENWIFTHNTNVIVNMLSSDIVKILQINMKNIMLD